MNNTVHEMGGIISKEGYPFFATIDKWNTVVYFYYNDGGYGSLYKILI